MTHDLKEGSYVEIVLMATVEHIHLYGADFRTLDGSLFCLSKAATDQAKITKLEPELKAGRAEIKASGQKGRVVHIEDFEAWFRFDDARSPAVVVPVRYIRNIPEDGQ